MERTVDLLYKRKESILKKKDGVLTNGGFEKKTKKKQKKKTFSGLSESLTRFTISFVSYMRILNLNLVNHLNNLVKSFVKSKRRTHLIRLIFRSPLPLSWKLSGRLKIRLRQARTALRPSILNISDKTVSNF